MYEKAEDVRHRSDTGEPIADGKLVVYLKDKESHFPLSAVSHYNYESYGLRIDSRERRVIFPWNVIESIEVIKNSDFYVHAINEFRNKQQRTEL